MGKVQKKMLQTVRTIKVDKLLAAVEKQDNSCEHAGRWVNPHFASLHVLVAQDLALQGELEDSTNELLVGNSRFPGHSELLVEMGRNLISRQQSDQAMEWLSAAILLDQNCHEGFFETSFLHASRDNLFLASQALRHAVTLRPLFPDYRFHFGMLLKDLGETAEAIAEFRRALVIKPEDALCELHLASALLESGNPKETVNLIMSGKCREWPEALIVAAQAHVALGQEKTAREIIDGLVKADAGYANAHELLDAVSDHAN